MKTIVFLVFVIGAIWAINYFQTGLLLSIAIILAAVTYGLVAVKAVDGFSRKRGGDP